MKATTEMTDQHAMEQPAVASPTNGPPVWRAGTLTYTRAGLVRLFALSFFGYFSVALERGALPLMLPLLLRAKGFNAGEIGTLISLFPLTSLFLGPVFGVMTDRTRTRFGRRRPYLLLFSPLWVLGLMLLPQAESMWVAAGLLLLVGAATTASDVLSAYYNDVVPPELMGRFSAATSLVYSLACIVFQAGIMRFFDAHMTLVFVGMALFGFAGQTLMALLVPEGTYPPPPPRKSIVGETAEFLREGFANRYIIFLWLTLGMTALGGPAIGNYFNLFYTDDKAGLHMSSEALGNLLAIGSAVGMILIVPAGWIVDQFGPKKIWALSGFAVGMLQVCMFFAPSSGAVFAIYIAYACANTVLGASLGPMNYAFIPQAKFCQLSAASGIISRALSFFGLQASGWLIAATGNEYRYAFLFAGAAYMFVPLFMMLMVRQPYPYVGMNTTMNPDGKRGKTR